jgi:hypothetical protein
MHVSLALWYTDLPTIVLMNAVLCGIPRLGVKRETVNSLTKNYFHEVREQKSDGEMVNSFNKNHFHEVREQKV